MIPDFIKSLLGSPIVKARVEKYLRAASLAAGAWALTSTYVYVTTHFTSVSQADAATLAGVVSSTVSGLILSVGAIVYSQIDATKTDQKITTAAVTGSVTAPQDKEVRKVVMDTVKAVPAPTGSQESIVQAQELLRAGVE